MVLHMDMLDAMSLIFIVETKNVFAQLILAEMILCVVMKQKQNLMQLKRGTGERDERFVNFFDTCSNSWFIALFIYKVKRSYKEVMKKQNIYKGLFDYQSEFSHRYACWAKMKKAHKRIAKKRLKRIREHEQMWCDNDDMCAIEQED